MNNHLLQDFQPIALISPVFREIEPLIALSQLLNASLHLPDTTPSSKAAIHTYTYSGSLKDYLGTIWSDYRVFIFCLASGAVVRLIAPFLRDKSSDPAIIVLDLQQKWVISLCSGHQGGADQLTQLISAQIEAIPVITSGSEGINWSGLDRLGLPFGWRKGTGDWTKVSAAIVQGKAVQVIQEGGSTLWQQSAPNSLYFDFPEGDDVLSPRARIWISATQRKFAPDSQLPKVQWHPRLLWLGIGCIRGTSLETLETAIRHVLQQHHLAYEAIAGIATIELKQDEVGLVEFCEKEQFPLKVFTSEQLRAVNVPNPSQAVEDTVNTPSVAEAAAILAAQSENLLEENPSGLIVPKQVFAQCVTVAIAHSAVEYTGRMGQLFLVGMGPGDLGQMTPSAKAAIASSDVIIGYSLYLDLIKPLKHSGQRVEAFPITQEKERSQRAIELARWGLTVTVVSSGDCGIYGMAGLVFEELTAQGWDGKIPKIEVFPGITALQAAAARVGAPLMHDFCAISLSDLLTPWEVIEKRLKAAAEADFVTALYNPRSQTRTQQIVKAQEYFLQYRSPNTPVALVYCAYRAEEQIILTNLSKILDFPIDMLTTVLIGNRSTYQHGDWLITPRGYSLGLLT